MGKFIQRKTILSYLFSGSNLTTWQSTVLFGSCQSCAPMLISCEKVARDPDRIAGVNALCQSAKRIHFI